MSSYFRFQGTDGVRRHVGLSKNYPGLTPQQVFMKNDVITEHFMELYTFAAVSWMIDQQVISNGDNIVIGWDPRDPSGIFTSAALEGINRAGCNVLVAGIAPTPAVVAYMLATEAAAGFMITASHNPSTYNGIKIFTRQGLKLLPWDDIELSGYVMNTDFKDVMRASPNMRITDNHYDATQIFAKFSLDPRNSWIDDDSVLNNITLILDCANGAFSNMAEDICVKAGFGKVITLNRRIDGTVNENCGVAELEGIDIITQDMIAPDGALHGNEVLEKLFELGRSSNGKNVSAAVFDGDGDRFFRIDYDNDTDTGFVLTGDETSILQAKYLNDQGKLFLNTVESDLSSSIKAKNMGYKSGVTCVGDKWILLEAALTAIKPNVSKTIYEKIETIARSPLPSAIKIEKLLCEEDVRLALPEKIEFAIGAEESGHNITPGVINSSYGDVLMLAGNGMKSLLNSYASTVALTSEETKAPFARGFKKTLYTFYIDKRKWHRDGSLWDNIRISIGINSNKIWPEATLEEMIRPEDTDMLYYRMMIDDVHLASLFIRNSGTEDKIGVTLRSTADISSLLLEIGVAVHKILILSMKESSKPMVVAEAELIRKASKKGAPSSPPSGLDEKTYGRLLSEAGAKQGMLSGNHPGARLTELGEWYLQQLG